MATRATERDGETGIEQGGKTWRPLLMVGGILSILGVLAVAFPFATGIGVEIALGALFIVGGIAQGVHAFGTRGWTGFLGEAVLGGLYLVAGLAILSNPVLGLATLTLLVGAFFLADGLIELSMGLRVRPETSWIGLLVSGVFSLVLAGLILVGWPATTTWAIGLLVGVNLFTTGIALAAVAMGTRRMGRVDAQPIAP